MSFQRLALSLLIVCLPLRLQGAELRTIEISLQGTVYQIELATTTVQRRQGLMQRAQLGANQGMLLVYPRSGDHRVWMKNMLIPLRVYWIDDRFKIVSMQRLEPCSGSPCPVYAAQQPTRYILELSDREHALQPGDVVDGLESL